MRVGEEAIHDEGGGGRGGEAGLLQKETLISLSPLRIIGFMIMMCLMLLSLYYFYKYLG